MRNPVQTFNAVIPIAANRILRTVLLFVLPAFASWILSSCSAVKPYQRAYLNDSEMEMGTKPVSRFDDNVHTYREGAAGGGTEKGSGGCGCN